MCIFNAIAYTLIKSAAKATFGESGELLDGGSDLDTGLAVYYFDIVYVCVITQILGLFSDKFLLFLLSIPAYASFKLWKEFLGPWFFAKAEQQPVEDEKTRKKREKQEKKAEKPKYKFVKS
eukprot:gene4009-5012_t